MARAALAIDISPDTTIGAELWAIPVPESTATCPRWSISIAIACVTAAVIILRNHMRDLQQDNAGKYFTEAGKALGETAEKARATAEASGELTNGMSTTITSIAGATGATGAHTDAQTKDIAAMKARQKALEDAKTAQEEMTKSIADLY